MFTTLSRATTVLVASSLLVATAGTVATFHDGQLRPDVATHASGAGPEATAPAVTPRPGEVDVCDEPSSEEIVKVPDKGAPDGKRSIWVRRPPGSDNNEDTPVLYLLHGSTTSHLTLKDADLGPILDEAMCASGVEFVVAAPHGQEVGGSDTEWGDDVDGDFNIESFVTEKAVKAVEGEDRRPRSLRAIGGFSMGGYGAAALPLRHPDLYSQAVSWAGYFKVDDPSDTFGKNTDPHAPDQLLDKPGVQDIRFMLIEGKDDHTPLQEGSIHGEAKRFAALLRDRDMTVRTAFPEGDHSFTTWNPTVPEAVEFLTEGWSDPGTGRRGN